MSHLQPGDWVQVVVGSVLFVTILAVLWYAWEARKQAKASWAAVGEMRKQADASLKMVEETRDTRLAFDQPKLLVTPFFQEWDADTDTPRKVEMLIGNRGRGHAFNVNCELRWPGWTFTKCKFVIIPFDRAEPPPKGDAAIDAALFGYVPPYARTGTFERQEPGQWWDGVAEIIVQFESSQGARWEVLTKFWKSPEVKSGKPKVVVQSNNTRYLG